jgi:hypothetical protein
VLLLISNILVFFKRGTLFFIYKDDLKMVNVFSSIAAGKPIYMSGDVEEKFPLSLGLISGSEDHFILKVKSDRRGCHFEKVHEDGGLDTSYPGE